MSTSVQSGPSKRVLRVTVRRFTAEQKRQHVHACVLMPFGCEARACVSRACPVTRSKPGAVRSSLVDAQGDPKRRCW